MLRNKLQKQFPKSFLWKITLLNIAITTIVIAISSWAVYSTACILVENNQSAEYAAAFRVALRQDLWIFSVIAILTGGLLHLKSNRALTKPIRELIRATKELKSGADPRPVAVRTNGDMQELILHFNDLVDQLSYNRRQQKKLVSDLSHEIRTPISNINGYLNALKNGVIEGSPDLYTSLHNESERLIDLVEQLERLKEWDDARHQHFLAKDQVNAHDLVSQAANMFKWTLQDRGIQCEVHAEPMNLVVDGAGITQVLANLIENAIRYYSGEGPVRITGERMESAYRITVAGPGLPIPEEDRTELFTRFHRVERSRKRETGGLGLGLAISDEIVCRHGGKLFLETDGHSHAFQFTIPCRE
ncbi:two-component system, OmpR family, sensor histidine kinase BaeS [Bhargavaea beijingensis]|uniref:histidine kinase n=1 Tax=Bhargavaea beijingensis TaxID=426756 RepID=A0A1G7E3C3_9BACL|nr:two-component system, OmpR family, sensor histidine kinase BaeS [Bhargavaea beijingensis]